MSPGLQALLAGVIDYAGLFPPAKLPLEEAIRNYAHYRTEPESSMLGRFICPAARLAELAPFEELFRDGPPFVFSVLGRGGNSVEEFLDGMRADLEAIQAFRSRHQGRALVDVLEVKMSPELAETLLPAPIPSSGSLPSLPIADMNLTGLNVYVETELRLDWRPALVRVTSRLGYDNARFSQSGSTSTKMGFKLRCGGLEASAFPSAEQVASVLDACRTAAIPLKCTAGLHHPMRHFNSEIGTSMHGFLNVFGAGVLAHARRLEESRLQQIIEEEDPGAFRFDEAGFQWRDVRASMEEIVTARKVAVISFGSCSFDEPREDLLALGLLN